MKIIELKETTTVMDEARALIAQNKLKPFDSVIAEIQTKGRGQRGHNWLSPVGNIYACMVLPLRAPFDGPASPLAFSSAVSSILIRLGFNVQIKWMNDLVIDNRKVAGILLEKFGSTLIAGVGINLQTAPSKEFLRSDTALEATSLKDLNPKLANQFTPQSLWRKIALGVRELEEENEIFHNWHALAERLLLWKNEPISIQHNGITRSGILLGIQSDGALLLKQDEKIEAIYQGSIRSMLEL